MQANSERLAEALDRLEQQTVQLITLSHFSYQDLLHMEIRERERHYKKFVELKKEQSGDTDKKPFAANKYGYSRYRR